MGRGYVAAPATAVRTGGTLDFTASSQKHTSKEVGAAVRDMEPKDLSVELLKQGEELLQSRQGRTKKWA